MKDVEQLTDEQVTNLLRSEYPKMFQCEIDRMLKSCRFEAWFVELYKSKRLGEKPKGIDTVVVAANAGGVAPDTTPATDETKYGKIPVKYYDDPNPETLKPDWTNEVKVAEWMMNLMLATSQDQLRHMYASVAIGLLKNNLDRDEVAAHFGKTRKRVDQVVDKVENFRKKDLDERGLD